MHNRTRLDWLYLGLSIRNTSSWFLKVIELGPHGLRSQQALKKRPLLGTPKSPTRTEEAGCGLFDPLGDLPQQKKQGWHLISLLKPAIPETPTGPFAFAVFPQPTTMCCEMFGGFPPIHFAHICPPSSPSSWFSLNRCPTPDRLTPKTKPPTPPTLGHGTLPAHRSWPRPASRSLTRLGRP